MKRKLSLFLMAGLIASWPSHVLAMQITETDEEFFKNPSTKIVVGDAFEENNTVRALVTGTRAETQEERTTDFLARTNPVRYENHDESLYSNPVLKGNVIIGAKLYPLLNEVTSDKQIPYKLLREEQVESPTQTLGEWYKVYKRAVYERPNGTSFNKDEPLLERKKTEQSSTVGTEKACIKEEKIISKMNKKRQHTIQLRDIVEHKSILWQRDLNGQNEKIVDQKTRTEKKFKNQYQTCDNNDCNGLKEF